MQTLETSQEQIKAEKLWQLIIINGRQQWVFNENEYQKLYSGSEFEPNPQFLENIRDTFRFDKIKNPNSADIVYRKSKHQSDNDPEIPDWLKRSSNFSSSLEKKANSAAFKGIRYYESLQSEDGHWPGDYGGPLFLLPALIIVSHVTDKPFSPVKQELMKCYMLNHQNDDGGWGLHIEGTSTMFGTVMQYCALRILGLDMDEDSQKKARDWIHENGGTTGIPSWGKFFLCVLGVYRWEGCNSLMPEMWLLPKWLPIHPWRYWCHARMVYLAMAYCYGHRITTSTNKFIEELRQELYIDDYDKINWIKDRNEVCGKDRFHHTSGTLKWLLKAINIYERFASTWLRNNALKFILEYVNAEDEQTKFIDIGPVNQIINSLCIWHAYGNDSELFKAHVDRWDDYLWLAEDGMKMSGYNGSQLWDTAFATQALLENQPDLIDPETIAKAYSYINYSQIKDEVKDRQRFFRHQSVGGWPFSTLDHGWPIADCTAEGIKAVLKCHGSEFIEEIDDKLSTERLQQAIDLIISFQNEDGGWATYENTRSGPFLELLNPSEVFGKIMVDYSWVECTSACITALKEFNRIHSYRSPEIQSAIDHGMTFIRMNQNEDGSWIGSWGVCFTYGTWFGIEALTTNDETYTNSSSIKKACDFLISKQKSDGGWGESHLSCVTGKYANHEQSQVVNTAWALLSLMASNYPNKDLIDHGIKFLLKRQMKNGDWPQEGISGVFNQNSMITYTSYRNVFPLWAIGRYLEMYSNSLNYRGSNFFHVDETPNI